MKEFDSEVSNLFNGLYDTEVIKKNASGLYECHNLEPIKDGYSIHDVITHLNTNDRLVTVSGSWDIGSNWPYPQIFLLSNYLLAVALESTNLSLYEITESSGTYTAVKVVVLGVAARIRNISIADFGEYYVITASGLNGSTQVTEVYQRTAYAAAALGAVTEITDSTSFPTASTCCNFRGQLILGGLVTTQAPWTTLGPCSVAWSGIGHSSPVFSHGNDHSAGMLRLPWDFNDKGFVYKVLPLSNKVKVYGDRGICDLIPFTVEPVVGFGFGNVIYTGLVGPTAVAGNENKHCFIDRNYNLWLSTPEGDKNLGYKKHMETLINGQIIISYDPVNDRFYISDGVKCYVLTQFGLYSTHQLPTSVCDHNGTLFGFILTGADNNIRLTTSDIDFKYQSLKSIESLEWAVNADFTLFSSIHYRYDYLTDYTEAQPVELNDRGIATRKITARDFRFQLEGGYYSDASFELSSLIAKVKFVDKRNIRGRKYAD